MVVDRIGRRRWFLASLIATLALGVSMLVARIAFAAPLPPEMLFNYTGRLLGIPAVFNLVHALPWGLDAYAKYALFATTVVLYLALWFVLGIGVMRLLKRRGFVGIALLPLVSVLLVGLVLLPIQGLGLFGLSSVNFQYPPVTSHLWALGFGLVFALALALSVRSNGSSAGSGTDDTRRRLLENAGKVGLLLAAGPLLGRLVGAGWARAQGLVSFLGSLIGLSPEITPTADHYQVSKNVFNPSVPERGWSLRVTGMVANEVELTLEDIKALPSVERSSTLTCISNQVGGDLIGNSVWTGVRLSDLLDMAGVDAGASELVLRAADNYSDSFPLDAALREGTIVAYLQNGEPLTSDHGFPARVLVPGIYGMKNVKWVQVIELTDQDYIGYWQTRGWSDLAVVQTMSRIDTAKATTLEDGKAAIGGIAFAGIRGIAAVEVSIDGGQSWEAATLDPPENDLSWTLWGYSWEAAPGSFEVWVRATDGTGATQQAERSRPLPDGATGYHMVRVQVS